VVSGTEVVVDPIDIIMGEESCHTLAACPPAGGGAADGAGASCGCSRTPAPSGDGAVVDAGGSGCDSASDSKGESNEPSGCCADADVEDRNGLDVEICVKLGDEVTAAM
jgi:hypothetical protein